MTAPLSIYSRAFIVHARIAEHGDNGIVCRTDTFQYTSYKAEGSDRLLFKLTVDSDVPGYDDGSNLEQPEAGLLLDVFGFEVYSALTGLLIKRRAAEPF